MNTLYLSVEQSRRLAVEMPVGDPYGGVAYGKRQMPVIAVVAAAASFVAGASALVAGAAGLAALSAGAMVVGGALTVIGTISGNSKLAKIGGILSLAGGIGSLATGATEAAATAAGSGAEAGVADTIAGAVGEAGGASSAFGDVAVGGVDLGGTTTYGLDEIGGIASETGGAANASMAVGEAAPKGLLSSELGASDTIRNAVTNADQGVLGIDPTNAMNAAAPNAMTTANTSVAQSLNTDAFNVGDIIQDAAGNATKIVQGSNGELGFFDKAGKWVKANKELAKIGSDFASGLIPSEQEKATTDYYNQRTAELARKARWATGRI